MSTFHRPAQDSASSRLVWVALALLLVPAAALLALGVGEFMEGELSGAQHLPEAALLVALGAAAWWRRRLAGIVLVVVAPLLLIAWVSWVLIIREESGNDPVLPWLITAAILFLFPFLAGWLLLRASDTR
ncbi:MAG: hypothetical protein HS107_12350 [Thermoflexaceae bacterium]|nr:hypothetical protein [Thermoflexaceae bacterium]